MPTPAQTDRAFMRLALQLARRGYGLTSPNPMVGALLVKGGRIIGRGWHRRAGLPHAEIEALRDAQAKSSNVDGATLYVTLEPCCSHGRTPPCTDAILKAGLSRVVAAATDPNPNHAGRGFELLEKAGVRTLHGVLAGEALRLNEAFNHWIVHRTPFVLVKAAMSLDGKIATASNQSRWITGQRARAFGMKLRQGADAILVGINTLLLDDPKLTIRKGNRETGQPLRRLVLDPQARTPLGAQVLCDAHPEWTTIVVSEAAPPRRVSALAKRGRVIVAPLQRGRLDLIWLLRLLGGEEVISLLVEGGGETNASFLLQRMAQRIAFFYAPKILGGRSAPKAVAGEGISDLAAGIQLRDLEWRRLGTDLLLTARVD